MERDWARELGQKKLTADHSGENLYEGSCHRIDGQQVVVACPTHRNPPGSGLGTGGILF